MIRKKPAQYSMMNLLLHEKFTYHWGLQDYYKLEIPDVRTRSFPSPLRP